MSDPQIDLSVVFLSHDRGALLVRALDALRAQDFPAERLEVIVVDNASTDGTPDRIERDYPDVQVLRQTDNTGIRGRNVGLHAARGDVVLSCDDDIELIRPDALTRLHAHLTASPDLGALTLKICEHDTGLEYVPAHWWHPRPRQPWQDREFPTDHLNEAAVAFRRSAVLEAGAYYEDLFWGAEEWDLALGLLDLGYAVHYYPEPVWHLAPRGSLNERADPRHALLVRNRLWIALRRLPLADALAFGLPRLVVWGARAVRHGYLRHYLAGVGGLLRRLPRIWRERRPISGETRARLRRIRAGATGTD